jgi:cell division protein FtsB
MSTTRPTARDGFVRGTQQGNVLTRHSLFFIVGLGLVIVTALVQFGENGIFQLFHLRARETALRQEVAELETRNQELDDQLQALADDPEALEKLARERHNMRRPEEEVLTVLPPSADE